MLISGILIDKNKMGDEISQTVETSFPQTQWTSIIEVIQRGGDAESFASLNELCSAYKPAIVRFFCGRGFTRSEAEDLTQSFYHRRIVVPWNRRHGMVSILYAPEEIKKLPLLITVLKRRTRPLAAFIWDSFSDEARASLEKCDDSKPAEARVRETLASELNCLIEGPSIYEETRFAGVDLSVESRNLLSRELTGCWGTWLNRSLLGDAFPRHLVKGIGFLYLVERKERHKFRSFLSHALWCFLKDETKAQESQKAGGSVSNESLDQMDDAGYEVGSVNYEEFGREFDVAFAVRIIELAAGQSKYSKQLEEHLRGRISQKQAADELGMSENAFKAAYHRFRLRLAKNLRLEVAKSTGPDEKEIQAEIQYIISLLSFQA